MGWVRMFMWKTRLSIHDLMWCQVKDKYPAAQTRCDSVVVSSKIPAGFPRPEFYLSGKIMQYVGWINSLKLRLWVFTLRTIPHIYLSQICFMINSTACCWRLAWHVNKTMKPEQSQSFLTPNTLLFRFTRTLGSFQPGAGYRNHIRSAEWWVSVPDAYDTNHTGERGDHEDER